MDIGTAKPTAAERALVPHHLIDVADPDEAWSLAAYQEAALESIRAIQSRKRLPMLVGGTGQYVWGLLEGWAPPANTQDFALREELDAFAAARGPDALHRRLEAIDPQRAAEIDPRNVRRVIRALEIYHLTGRPPSEVRRKNPPPFASLILGLSRPREELYSRIDERIDAMLEAGWVEETRRLLERDLPPSAPALTAIGYREIASYLQGEIAWESALAEIRRSVRLFVRRQSTWFKPGDARIEWYEVRSDLAQSLEARIKTWLEAPGTPPGDAP